MPINGRKEPGTRPTNVINGEIMTAGETNTIETSEDTIESLQEQYDTLFSKLPTKRKRFLHVYLETLDSKKAAIEAGYSKHTAVSQGNRMLRKGSIPTLVSLSNRLLASRSRISQDWIMHELKGRYEECVKEGKEQAATANLNLMGQHLGMFGKGKDNDKGDLHLHKHFVNYPPVPENISEWVKQMREIGFDAMLPERSDAVPESTPKQGEDDDSNRATE